MLPQFVLHRSITLAPAEHRWLSFHGKDSLLGSNNLTTLEHFKIIKR
jgi:hypothetical protein